MTEESFSSEGSTLPPPIESTSPTPPPVPPTNRWRWWIHLLLIGTYPFLGGLVRSHNPASGPAFSGTTSGLLTVSTLEIFLFTMVFALGWLASRASWEELSLRWRPGWWVVPLGVSYSVAIRFALLIIIMIIGVVLVATRVVTVETLQGFMETNSPDVEVLVSVSALQQNSAYFWLMLTLVSFVIAGLREELWRGAMLAGMRALWPKAFGSSRGQYLAVTLIAILFGTMHLGMGAVAAALAGIVGWFLGVIIVLHRSICPAVIAHGMFDATTFAILPWALEKLQHYR